MRRAGYPPLDQHGDRIAARLEDRMRDVAEVLAVRLQRQRPVAVNLDPVEIESGEDLGAVAAAAEDRPDQPRDVASAHAFGRGEGEPVLEARCGRDANR